MKDGHLNKCAECVVKDVAEWRIKTPDARQKEHSRKREKQGFQTRKEYLDKKKANAKGRKAVALAYAHKRRIQIKNFKQTEFDDFVFTEAVILKDLRKKTTNIEWHIDHIVPINFKHACGLHNAFNLQVVPAEWNFKKGNKNMDRFFEISGY